LIRLRGAYFAAAASLTALIALSVAWELWLAPLRPGGSWVVLKVVPLLAPLLGILRGRPRTYQWAAMLMLAYFVEGIARGYAESGRSALLAHLEAALASTFIASAILFVRAARTAVSKTTALTPED